MSEHYFDQLEIRDRDQRERSIFALMPDFLRQAMSEAPGWGQHLAGIDPGEVTSRAALSKLPLLRKSALTELQARRPPFGGLAIRESAAVERIYMSPGPIFDPEGRGADWWRSARALHAAGVGAGDVVLNTFSYHLTPGGWIIDSGLRALGCSVIPAGPGNVEQQLDAIAHLKPSVYVGVPDFLKVLLDRGREVGRPTGSLRKAFFSGGALYPALRHEFQQRGIAAFQAYAIADAGMIAYETRANDGSAQDRALCDGLVVDEGIILEIVRPGTGIPVADGEVGEMVVTSFNRDYPMIRLATGDLSAIVPGTSPCGRTNMRIRGWLGRAEQSTKVKGLLVNPEQVAEIGKRHGELRRLRLVVGRTGETDALTLKAEAAHADEGLADRIAATLVDVTKVKGDVLLVSPGSLPNDGRVIADERSFA